MAKYIDADLLMKEIEHRIDILAGVSTKHAKNDDTEMYNYYHGKAVSLEELLSFIGSLNRRSIPDFPITDKDIKEFLATHPKIKVPEKYKNPDWLLKKQEQPDTEEQSSHLEHWLAFFGCPEENIEKCATQIAQGYGAIRFLEGVQLGAEAVNELAQQEQPDNEDIDKVAQELYEHLYELKRRNNVPTNLYDKQEIIDLWKAGIVYRRSHPKQEQPEVDLEKEIDRVFFQKDCGSDRLYHKEIAKIARHFYELGLKARKEKS